MPRSSGAVPRRAVGLRLPVAVVTWVALLWVGASGAAALVVHPGSGHFLGIAPRPPAATSFASPPAVGPLRAAPRAGTPTRAAGLSGGYESLQEQFLTDVAAVSRSHTATPASDNVYSVTAQYTGSGSPPMQGTYDSTFGGGVVDNTTPFPADGLHGDPNGCTPGRPGLGDPPYTWCLTDAQVQGEIDRITSQNGLPRDTSAVYFVFLGPGVDECFGPGAEDMTNNPCADTDFCAYHSSYGTATPSPPLYGVLPYAGVSGCEVPQSTNGDLAADSQVSILSHEHQEVITDPFGTSWADATGNEIADKCASQFGPFTPGVTWNQTIHSHHYILQEEFSNADGALCEPSLNGRTPGDAPDTPGPLFNPPPGSPPGTQPGPVLGHHTTYAIFWDPPAPAPVASFSAPGTGHLGQALSLDASASHDVPGQSLLYAWDFGDGAGAFGPTVSHTYATPGDHIVRLTVTDSSHAQSTSTGTIHIFTPPTASFTAPNAPVTAGQPAAFDASASAGREGPIASYAWSFGDGTAGEGAHVSHVYAVPGVYSVGLTVTDSNQSSATAGAQVDVVAAPVPATARLVRTGSPHLKKSGASVLLVTGRKLSCLGGVGTCAVSVTITTTRRVSVALGHGGHRVVSRRVTLGTARFTAPAGHSATITVRVNKAGVSLLRRLRRLKQTVAFATGVVGHASARSKLSFTATAPRGLTAGLRK